jgi:hypothetical protein
MYVYIKLSHLIQLLAIHHVLHAPRLNKQEHLPTCSEAQARLAPFPMQAAQVPAPGWSQLKPPGLELKAQMAAPPGAHADAAVAALAEGMGGALCAAVPAALAHGEVSQPVVGWFGRQPVAG